MTSPGRDIMGSVAQGDRPMIGRDAELDTLGVALAIDEPTTSSTAPRHVLLSGDAGVGKTRLLMALRDRAQAQEWQVLAGHCLDFGDAVETADGATAPPYLPFTEVLGRLEALLPDVVETVSAQRPALARLLPGSRRLTGGDTSGRSVDRGGLFEAMHLLLEAAAEKAPVLLAIEDLHWADRSTRELVGYLFTREFGGRVVLVASYRSDDLHRRHPLRRQVAEWARLGAVTRLALDPLAEGDVRRLVADLSVTELTEATVAAIVGRADGNAFFIEELVASHGDEALPDDLADLLLVRLEALDDAGRDVVRTVSVAGGRVDHEQLSAVTALTPDALDRGWRDAVERNVLVSSGDGYRFRHALLGEAVYDDLLPGERVRLHSRYADALASGRAHGTAAELARHARRAHDLDTALTASLEAAGEALAVGGPDEAARLYQQGLELLDPDRARRLELDRSRVAVLASDAVAASGDTQRSVQLLAEALDDTPPTGDPSSRARLLAAYARRLLSVETDLDPVELAAEAVRLAPAGENGLRATTLAALANVLTGYHRYDEAQAAALEGLALAERLGRPMLVADLITTMGHLKRSGPREALRTALESAVEQAQRHGATDSELRARFLLGRSFQDQGEWADAVTWFSSALEVSERIGRPWAPYAVESRWHLSWILMVRGDWDAVLALTAIADEPAAPPVVSGLLQVTRLYVLEGRGTDIGAELAELQSLWEVDGGIAVHAAGLAIDRLGRSGDAAGALAAYAEGVRVLSGIWQTWFGGRLRLAASTLAAIARVVPSASAAERERWATEAAILHADGLRVIEEYDDVTGWGPEGHAWHSRLEAEHLRLRWLAGVDAPPIADLVRVWRECEQRFVTLGHVAEIARVRLALAGVLRAIGEGSQAREVTDLARASAHSLGAQPLLDDLVALGSGPARRAGRADTSRRAALTARETEILALVAAGRTNGEIGSQLVISTKTVSVHVSNILAKLEARSRTEAAAIARSRGLLD